MLEIKTFPDTRLTKEDLESLHTILESGYRIAESDLWVKPYARIAFGDFLNLVREDRILIAFYNKKIVGCIHYYQKTTKKFGFGLLAVDFDYKGLGIGRGLISQVERLASKKGAEIMELELLRPKGVNVPFKERLREWYERMGYVYTHSQNFAEIKPVKAQNLKRPSDFDYYTKSIRTK